MHHAKHTIEKHQINEAKETISHCSDRAKNSTEIKVQALSEEYVPTTVSNYSISNLTHV